MFFAETEISLEFLGVFKIKREKSEEKTFFPRTYDALSIRLDGSACFETENGEMTVKPGDVLYVPKNAKYTQRTRGETIFAIHFVNYSFYKSSGLELLTVDDRAYVESLVREMYGIWKEQAQGYRHRCVSLLYTLLYYLNCQAPQSNNGIDAGKKLLKAVDYIHANYRTEQIEIEKLSSMCNVSQTYFRRIFKEIHGISPLQYIINLRLEFASHLLKSRLYTVLEVSEKSGFGDSKYFCRLFKKRFGCTPAEFRNILPEKGWE